MSPDRRKRGVADSPATEARASFRPADEFDYHRDHPAELHTILFEVAVTTRLDADWLRETIAAAVRLHPMARARAAAPRPLDRRHIWEITATPDLDPLTVLTHRDHDTIGALRAELVNDASGDGRSFDAGPSCLALPKRMTCQPTAGTGP